MNVDDLDDALIYLGQLNYLRDLYRRFAAARRGNSNKGDLHPEIEALFIGESEPDISEKLNHGVKIIGKAAIKFTTAIIKRTKGIEEFHHIYTLAIAVEAEWQKELNSIATGVDSEAESRKLLEQKKKAATSRTSPPPSRITHRVRG
jgi:hypothetical protein